MDIKMNKLVAPNYGEQSVIEIDLETGAVTASQQTPRRPGEGTPIREWHGIVRVYTADSMADDDGRTHVDPSALLAYLGDDGAKLLQAILDGSEVVWDGSNHVGRMSDAAQQAEAQFEQKLRELPRGKWVDWTCEDWFGPVTSEIHSQPSANAARKYGESCADPDVLLDDDPGEWCAAEWQAWHDRND